jgi:hypothetical protein
MSGEIISEVKIEFDDQENLDPSEMFQVRGEGEKKSRKRKRSYVRKPKQQRMSSVMCLICNKEYVYEAFLTRHMVSAHRACAPIHQYKCRHCGAIFADEVGFDAHQALFFEFLKHHIDHVAPKHREQEEQAADFEGFVKKLGQTKETSEAGTEQPQYSLVFNDNLDPVELDTFFSEALGKPQELVYTAEEIDQLVAALNNEGAVEAQ